MCWGNVKMLLRRKFAFFLPTFFYFNSFIWGHNYTDRYNLERYKLTAPGNSLLKSVETPSSITQFAKLKPAIIVESGLACECLLSIKKRGGGHNHQTGFWFLFGSPFQNFRRSFSSILYVIPPPPREGRSLDCQSY